MCGQAKQDWNGVQISASVVMFGQFSEAAEIKPSKLSKQKDS